MHLHLHLHLHLYLHREANNVAASSIPDLVPEDVIAKNIDYRQQVWAQGYVSRGQLSVTGAAGLAGEGAGVRVGLAESPQPVPPAPPPCGHVSTESVI